MGMKLEDRGFQERLRKRWERYTDPGVSHVEVGVTDASVAPYAAYVEYGWVQRVTDKQAGYLNRQLGKHTMKAGMALVNPPRPFLKGTMAAEAPKWRETAKKALQKTRDKEKALAILGTQAADDVRMTIKRGGTSKEKFPERAPLTMELYRQQSKGKGRKGNGGGNASTTKPLVLTGKLLNSIGFEVK